MLDALIQGLRNEQDRSIVGYLSDEQDKYLVYARFVGATGTLPTAKVFAKGCELVQVTDAEKFINTADSGDTPSWTQIQVVL